jgi:hypothetical protein
MCIFLVSVDKHHSGYGICACGGEEFTYDDASVGVADQDVWRADIGGLEGIK